MDVNEDKVCSVISRLKIMRKCFDNLKTETTEIIETIDDAIQLITGLDLKLYESEHALEDMNEGLKEFNELAERCLKWGTKDD